MSHCTNEIDCCTPGLFDYNSSVAEEVEEAEESQAVNSSGSPICEGCPDGVSDCPSEPPVPPPPEPPIPPDDIAGLGLWFKADAFVFTDPYPTLASNGQKISRWGDVTGSWALTNVTGPAALQPTFRTNIKNSLPVVRYDARPQFLVRFEISAQPQTLELVCKWDASTAGTDSKVITPDVSAGYSVLRNSSGIFEVRHSGGILNLQGGVLVDDEYYILGIILDGANSAIRVNGIQTAFGDLGTTGPTGTTFGGTGADGFVGDICEATRNSWHLDNATLAGLEQYLSDRWAITI